jgi:hypothetical protein
MSNFQLNDAASTWNPFIAAPFGDFSNLQLGSNDDHQSSFLNGRHGSMSSTCNVKSSESLIMAIHVADPFAAAPFDHAKFATRRTTEKTNTAGKRSFECNCMQMWLFYCFDCSSHNESDSWLQS